MPSERQAIARAKSITHEHLLSVINTEMKRMEHGKAVKILDVGCGDGSLIAYLLDSLPKCNPNTDFLLYGLDINDHGVQSDGYFHQTTAMLHNRFLDVNWNQRLTLISGKETWPYANDFFDIIVSNQVLEHVRDHCLLFSEIHRALKTGGFSVHLFPLKNYIYESHLCLPFVHRIHHYSLLFAYVRFLSWIGLGKYRDHLRNHGTSLNQYSEQHADYIHYFTNYMSYSEILKLSKHHNLRASFKYTKEFYTRKAASIMGARPTFEYKYNQSNLLEWIYVLVLKYASCVTLLLEKKQTYIKL